MIMKQEYFMFVIGITSSNELLQQLLGGEEGARRVLMNGPLGERYREKKAKKKRLSTHNLHH